MINAASVMTMTMTPRKTFPTNNGDAPLVGLGVAPPGPAVVEVVAAVDVVVASMSVKVTVMALRSVGFPPC